jgi:L-alanine-DL-glutamate epimerase-like enolase superfamily enzyme
MPIQIEYVNSQFEREPLVRPFGFKGGYMREIWQVAVYLSSGDGLEGMGLGTQNVLWSDKRVFTSHSESAGNCIMFAITSYALKLIKGQEFEHPIELQERIFNDVHEYAVRITGVPRLSKTFVLNALVPVDNAAWILYSRKNGITDFDQMIPPEYRNVLSYRHHKVASIPIASYGMPINEVRRLVDEAGFQILKFKLGSPGNQQEMLDQDKSRIEEIHKIIGHQQVSCTENGKFPYYLDMNGRYESKETLVALLEHADKIGAYEQIQIIEEPFPEDYKVIVNDLGVMVAADESAHTAENVAERIELGYGAIALKAIAKTLSTTLKMAQTANEHSIPCFCADLTVNPVLVDWNKNIAARLAPVPGFKTGLMETNGHQNYRDWNRMLRYHPSPNQPWMHENRGIFGLNDDFYKTGGSIFETSDHYRSLLNDE